MNNNFLYFSKAGTNGNIDAAHDVYCVPASKLRGMTNTGTTQRELTLFFEPIEGISDYEDASDATRGGDISDLVVLTVNDDTADDVAKALVAAINAGPHASGGVITIADLASQTFFNSNITDVGITVRAASVV
jgi:hypothetical protein|tara:strand:+ start:114 stop:512 length:399 start_codon:yes stop_codon:yes gene_type:complete